MAEERDPLKGEGPRTQPDALKGEVPETEGAGEPPLLPAADVPPLPAAEPSSQQQCHQCMVMFGDARAKERHMRRHHPEEYLDFLLAVSRLSCHVCALPFDSSRELIDHQRTQHPQGRPFLCPVCGDSFVQSHALINHKRRHLGQSRYACRDCAKTCRTLKQLLNHRRSHGKGQGQVRETWGGGRQGHPASTTPDPAPSPSSSSSSTAAAATGEEEGRHNQSLQCFSCFITFQDLQTSTKHMRFKHPAEYERQMQGRTVFACQRCERTFPSSRQLSTHQRTHRSLPPAGEEAPSPEEEEEGEEGEEEGSEGEGEAEKEPLAETQPVSSSHKCPHCNFLFSDLKTKNRHMNAKHPPGCREPPHRRPPPLLYSERPSEEGEVLTVRIKEEPEDFAASPEGSAGEEAPGSEREGSEEEEEEEEEREREREREKERELRETHESCLSHKCLYCSFLFSNLHTMQRHMSTKHPLLKRGGPSPGALGPPALKQACLEEGEGEGEGEVLTVRIKEEEQEESQTSGAFSAWGSNERPLQEEDPPFVCHVCSLPFLSPRALLAHQPSHLDPRPFKCPICGDGFEQPAALASHERRHLRQSRYVCRDCAMVCPSLPELLSHRRLHTEERPYSCQDCGRTFKRASGLQRHKSVHRGGAGGGGGAEGRGSDTHTQQ
ncbi:zinc finger protein 572-like isoform X1 [Acipenser ruthenus]|uniref:zinc finger protein 572-like isoform X1 n=1 Tax=Acipenser ruthenus TaxID=7906 RepID=UPI002740FA60|nr:zinc finger protein 572-like isoform X1 [Acipenser ruthenus]XP_058867152.1 zinc finger protein 572-like isoform X1 [Acipenser ruthenus]